MSRARIVAGREPAERIQHLYDVVYADDTISTAVLRAGIKVGGHAEPVAVAPLHRGPVREVVQDTQDVIEVRLRGVRRVVRQTDVCIDLNLELPGAVVVRITGALVINCALLAVVAGRPWQFVVRLAGA